MWKSREEIRGDGSSVGDWEVSGEATNQDLEHRRRGKHGQRNELYFGHTVFVAPVGPPETGVAGGWSAGGRKAQSIVASTPSSCGYSKQQQVRSLGDGGAWTEERRPAVGTLSTNPASRKTCPVNTQQEVKTMQTQLQHKPSAQPHGQPLNKAATTKYLLLVKSYWPSSDPENTNI